MGESLLGIELSETRGTLSGVLHYNRDIFRATSAQRIAFHLEVQGHVPALGHTMLCDDAHPARTTGIKHGGREP